MSWVISHLISLVIKLRAHVIRTGVRHKDYLPSCGPEGASGHRNVNRYTSEILMIHPSFTDLFAFSASLMFLKISSLLVEEMFLRDPSF